MVVSLACAGGDDPENTSFGGTLPMTTPMTMTAAMTTAMTEAGETGGETSAAGETEGGETGAGATTASPTTGGGEESGTAGTEAAEGGCPDGELGCPCLALDACQPGLTCEAGVCEVVMAVCGDGMLGGDEACDNGADNGDDKMCKSDCTLQACGDGFLGPGEACDDGNAVNDDACSNTCVPAACGDMVVQMGEACDDGNLDNTDACVTCKAAACGDTYVQAGVEGCDDGNQANDDGCSAACAVEPPKCGGKFTTDWCPQNGTMQQFTRCESVTNAGKTCNNPFIKYGSVEGGVPASHPNNDFNAWCTQLGFGGFSGQVSYGSRPCDAPQGKLFGYTGYDEPTWHWCDWQDGTWFNQQLDFHGCNDGEEITSITCQ